MYSGFNCHILGTVEKFKTNRDSWTYQTNSNGNTLRSISSGQTVPDINSNFPVNLTHPIKGTVSTDGYFFKVETFLWVLSVYALMVFKVFQQIFTTLQRKGGGESNINAWFPFMYSQKWNCYFQNRIIMFCLPVPSLIYLWEIYIFSGSFCLFCCREICGPILGIYSLNR